MSRIAFCVEYDGSQYNGWQSQDGQPAVQSELELALSKVADHPVTIKCAGRTDSGVHATAQVFHCDVKSIRTMSSWVRGGNTYLPADISILWAQEVENIFDARYSAIKRQYRYFIYNNAIRPGLLISHVTWHYIALNVEKMHSSAQVWLGKHDFSSFRAAGCQSKTAVRHVYSITVKKVGSLILFDIVANAFLYHMVRNMVGVLLAIGENKEDISYAQEILVARDRKLAGITASPNGLYLVAIEYPEKFNLPVVSKGPWFFI